MEFSHEPVLLEECMDGLNIRPDGIYVDGTLGGGGHSSQILKRLGEDGRLIGIDRDGDAIAAATARLGEDSRFQALRGNFHDEKYHGRFQHRPGQFRLFHARFDIPA